MRLQLRHTTFARCATLPGVHGWCVRHTDGQHAEPAHPGIGNLFTNPLLIRPLYKLSPFSPCLDRGDPAATLPATDYEGDARASISRVNGNAHPDLGADEYVLSGSARKYGLIGFGYFNFFPEIGSANSRVVIGEVLNVELTNAVLRVFGTPARDAFLAMGFRDDAAGLPFDLSVIQRAGQPAVE
jgi:hypothetical protein